MHITIMSMYSVIIIIIKSECPQESNKIENSGKSVKGKNRLNVGYQ